MNAQTPFNHALAEAFRGRPNAAELIAIEERAQKRSLTRREAALEAVRQFPELSRLVGRWAKDDEIEHAKGTLHTIADVSGGRNPKGLRMSTLSATIDQEVPRIEAALHQTLTAIHQADQNVRPREPISARDSLGQYLEKRTTFTPLQLEVDDLLDRPVGEALRQKVRLYGERLFEIGGVKLMQEVMYRVAERDPANESRRIGIMDKRWNGIGQGANSAGWMA